MDSVKVRKATVADVPLLSQSLANAFDCDPFVNWLVRRDKNRKQGIVQLFKTGMLDLSIPFGEVLTVDDCMGGALWIPSDNVKVGFLKQLSMVPAITKIAGFSGLLRAVGCMDVLDKTHPLDKHYYLFFLGVDPSQQKQGQGTALVQPILDKCDAEGVGAYLENTNDANLNFYQKHGFEITGEIIVGKDAPPLKAMWRKPVKK